MSINEADIIWEEQEEPTPSKQPISEEDIIWEEPEPTEPKKEELPTWLKVVKGIGDTAGKVGDFLESPYKSVTEGIDKVQADKKKEALQQKAIDAIAMSDQSDKSTLWSERIKGLLDAMEERVPSEEEAQKLKELQEQRHLEYDKTLQEKGLGKLALDEQGKKFLITQEGEEIPLEESITDTLQGDAYANKGVATGAIAGAIKGAKYGSTPLTKAIAAGIGGAIGSFTGSIGDTVANSFEIDKAIDAKLALRRASEEAIADPILTLLTAGTFKAAGKTLKFPLKVSKKIKEYVVDGNLEAAKKVVKEQGYDEETTKELVKEVAKFQHTPKGVSDEVDGWFDKNIVKPWEKTSKAIEGKETENTRDAFVDIANQDAVLFNDLEKVITENPQLAKPVSQTVTKRSESVEQLLKERSMSAKKLQSKIKEYEASVKKEYRQTKELFDEAMPEVRFNLNSTNLPQTLTDLQTRIGDTNIKSELEALSIRVQDAGIMKPSEFVEIREDINRILRKPSVSKIFKDTKALKGVKEVLDDSLYQGIENIKALDPQKVKMQFEKATKRYGRMKELQDTRLYKGIMSAEVSKEDIAKAMMKGTKSIDGTLEKLMSKLSPADREAAEFSTIHDIVINNQVRFNDQKAIDFVKLSEELDQIDMKNIKSASVRKSVQDLKDMGKYFKNDPHILEATRKAHDPNYNQGISQNPLVRYQTKIANFITDFFIMYSPTRMGRSPAFRYHLKKALKKKREPLDFMKEVMKHKEVPPSLLKNLQTALKEYQREALKTQEIKPKEQKDIQALLDEMHQRVQKHKEAKPEHTVIKPQNSILPESLSEDASERALQREYAMQKGQEGIEEYLQKSAPKQSKEDPYDLGLSAQSKEQSPPSKEILNQESPIADISKAKEPKLITQPQPKEDVVPEGMSKQDTAMPEASKEPSLLQRIRQDDTPIAEDIEEALKIPNIQITQLGKTPPEGFSKLKNFFPKQEKGQKVFLNDKLYEKYNQDAAEVFGTFQGGKREMANIAPQVISQVMPLEAREQITHLKDYFGGGGSWGVYLSKIDLFPNIKRIDIHELSPARAKKIEYVQSHAKEVADFLRSKEMKKLLTYILKTEREAGKEGSGTRIAKRLMEDVLQNAKEYTKLEQSAMSYLIDYGSASFGRKEGASKVLEHVAKQVENIGKTKDEIEKRGIKINYITGDSYAIPKEQGSHILAVVDPPYYKTKGYSYVDFDTGQIREAKEVGRDIYTLTQKMIDELDAKNNSIIYTDEAWWQKSGAEGIEEYTLDAQGKNAFNIALDIIDKADVFMKVPISKRNETLMIKNNIKGVPHEPRAKQTGVNPQPTTKSRDTTLSQAEPNRTERGADGGGYEPSQYPKMEQSAPQETSRATQPSYQRPELDQKQLQEQNKEALEYIQSKQEILENELQVPKELFERQGKSYADLQSEFIDSEDALNEANVKFGTDNGYQGYVKKTAKNQHPYAIVDEKSKNTQDKQWVRSAYLLRDEQLKKKQGDSSLMVAEQSASSEKATPDASSIAKETAKNQIFSHGALSMAGGLNGFSEQEDGTIVFDSQDMLKGMLLGAGIEFFGSRLLKGQSGAMRRASVGIRPDTTVQLYPKAQKVIEEKMPNAQNAKELKAMLKKAGVKEEELRWSGINSLSGKLQKEEVKELLEANALQLNEIIKEDIQTQKYLAYTEAGGRNYKEWLLTIPTSAKEFVSKHWEEPNVIAFMRTKERPIQGKKTLFIEEIQSDWHQQGKKQGYGEQSKSAVPDAPFKKTWQALALKRMLKEAIEKDFDSIAWTSAKTQEKRYALSKSLKELNYKKNEDGTYTLELLHVDGARDKRAYISPVDLPDHIGQKLATRVLQNEGEGTLQKQDLVIENKGMRTFYDQIIPKEVKKLLKTQPKKTKIGEEELWVANIKKEQKDKIAKEGIPLYGLGGTFSIGVASGIHENTKS